MNADTWNSGLTVAACALAFCAVSGCADKATAPGTALATLRVSAAVAAQSTPASAVDVYVGYARTNNEIVQLLKHRASISSSSQDVTVRVDLAPCLDDQARAAPLDVCVLRIDVVLRDENDAALDSITAPSVTAAPGGTINGPQVELTAGIAFTATFCTDAAPTAFAAYQDGTGPWKPLTIVNGAATFRIKSGRGAISWIRPNGTGWAMNTQYASAAELGASGTFSTCTAALGTASLGGSVIGLTAPEIARVSVGSSGAAATFATPSFSVPGLIPGTYPVVVARQNLQTGQAVPTAVAILRNVVVQATGTVGSIDLAAAFPVESYPLTIVNPGSDVVTTLIMYRAANQTGLAQLGAVPNTGTWRAVPTNLRLAGELHVLQAAAVQDAQTVRFAQTTIATPGARTLTFGPVFTPVQVATVATQPSVRLSTTLTVQPEYASQHSLQASQGSGATFRSTFMQVTEAYRQNSPTVTLTIPDLSNVAGWNPTWGLQAGVSTTWNVYATGSTGATVFQPYVDGAVQLIGYRSGTITP